MLLWHWWISSLPFLTSDNEDYINQIPFLISHHLHWSNKNFGEGNGNQLQYSCLENPMDGGAWWAAVHGVTKSRTWLSNFTFTFHFHALEKEMATHSSVLAWRILGTAEPGGLPTGSDRVGHDWSDLAAAAMKIFSSFLSSLIYYFVSFISIPRFHLPPNRQLSCLMYTFLFIWVLLEIILFCMNDF